MTRVFSGHSASHVFFLNELGDVYVLGRNEQGQCGLPISEYGTVISTATRLDRSKDFKPELAYGSDGDIVHIACGRHHTLLCTRAGLVYSTGRNTNGQCGHSNLVDIQGFRKIEASILNKDPVIQVGAGLTFSMLCTTSGKCECDHCLLLLAQSPESTSDRVFFFFSICTWLDRKRPTWKWSYWRTFHQWE